MCCWATTCHINLLLLSFCVYEKHVCYHKSSSLLFSPFHAQLLNRNSFLFFFFSPFVFARRLCSLHL
jgi:hypothetical protein